LDGGGERHPAPGRRGSRSRRSGAARRQVRWCGARRQLHHALAAGISRGFLIAAGIAVLAFPVVTITIRVHRSDLTGAIAAPTPASEVDRRSIDPEFPEASI
jgi:hypothetical protein